MSFCPLFPLNPTDTYPQIMSDGRAFTIYQTNDDLNKIMMNAYGVEDVRDYRHKLTSNTENEESSQLECLEQKYTTMHKKISENLAKLDKASFNN
tara:strand:- start:3664 stop:3948 length:285 start_codon:yes stop_codon:yes gene_type:complete